MRLDWLRADVASTRRAAQLMLALLLLSLMLNLVLALQTFRLVGRERIVVVPPTLHQSFWVEGERASREYLAQMGYFLMQLTLDVTPQSVDHQAEVLLQYAAPSAYGDLHAAMLATAARLKRDGASTLFSAQDLVVDEATQRVGIRGQLTTFIGDRRVSALERGYALELQTLGGRLFLTAFRETSPHDPLEIVAHAALTPAR